MLSVYVGGLTGGLISAALLGIPGTPSSVATTFDAFPMARKGDPGRALSLGVWASFFGTLISTMILVIAAPPLAVFAVKLGPLGVFLSDRVCLDDRSQPGGRFRASRITGGFDRTGHFHDRGRSYTRPPKVRLRYRNARNRSALPGGIDRHFRNFTATQRS